MAETASGPPSNRDISVTVRDTRSACALIGNRGRSIERRRRFVTSPYGRNRFRSTFEPLYLGNGARYEVGVH
jgi:hypothetical protein